MVFFGNFPQMLAIEQQLYREPEFSTTFELIKIKEIKRQENAEIKRQENAEFKRYLSVLNYTAFCLCRSCSKKYRIEIE
jgi:hypothetical protein